MDEPDTTAPQRIASELARCRQAAERRERPDLVARLDAAHHALAESDLSVVVVGEFKQGKSSLINALVGTEVCPVDHDIVTAVPTIVRFGVPPTVLVHAGPTGTGPAGSDGDPGTPIPFESIRDYVRERDEEGGSRPIRSVEIQIDRRILRSGLMFVDSPGIGGLESAEGKIALGVLNLADAVLFVTDASQELTLPELDFMRAALERCPRMACVVTKVDLYPEWRRIVDLDRGHLGRASLDVEVIPVSSFVRMRAATTNDVAMNEESGFPALTEFLRREVLEPGALIKAARAAAEVEFVTTQLRQGLEAESQVISRPEGAGEVVAQLSQAADAAVALRANNAAWQQVLTDGIQDLASDVDHDLRARLRGLTRLAEDVIDRSDPKSSWSEFESWLRRQVADAAVATYDYLLERAGDLTEHVGRQFSQDAGAPIAFSIAAPLSALEDVQLGGQFDAERGAKVTMALTAGRGAYGGMLMFGMAGSLLGLPLVAPVALVLSLGLARKALREDLKRRHQTRQQQAKVATRQYLDEVSFVVNKECRDALRRTQRLLRDEFTARAQSLHRSSTEALAHAEKAMRLDAGEREGRRRELEGELADLEAVGERVSAAVGAR